MATSPSHSPTRRSPRKKLGYDQEGVFDPEVNRAIARELYVDSTVNVVNSKLKGGGIKPGQMNLFNPKGQKSLAYSRGTASLQDLRQQQDDEFEESKRNMEQI